MQDTMLYHVDKVLIPASLAVVAMGSSPAVDRANARMLSFTLLPHLSTEAE